MELSTPVIVNQSKQLWPQPYSLLRASARGLDRMVGHPIATAPFAVPFKARDVEGRSFLDTVRGKKRPDLASDALAAMLSSQAPGSIYATEVLKTLKGYGLSGSAARDVLTALWRHALEAFLANDSAISDQEAEYLAALQRLFDLGEDDISPIRDAVVYARYEAVVTRAVAGYELNAAAKTVLQRVARQLRLPADVEERLYKNSARLAIAQRLKAVVTKRRASEGETEGILTLTAELGLPLTTEERNQLAVCYFLTRLDAGELPSAKPTVSLQKGETCHYVGVVGWSELRKARSGGGSYDELRFMDSGVLHVTDKRLLYTTDNRSLTVKYTTLLGAQDSEQHLLLQKATGKSPYLTFPDPLHRELASKTINRLITGDGLGAKASSVKVDSDPEPPGPPATPSLKPGSDAAARAPRTSASDASLKGLMTQLNALVGLSSVKREVASLVNFLRVQGLRAEQGLPASPISLHLVFTGNPGTGKTTVARLLAQIFKAMGLLLQGHLVETDRSGLVGGYVGQTALKTQGVAQRALGGVLFIDEAYALTVARDSTDYGSEAVDTILKLMEDNRDNLVVIVAGYRELMNQFLESNPGLRSRFTRFIEFPDYDAEELYEIFLRLTAAAHYTMSPSAEVQARQLFTKVHADRGPNFGNGRLVRNAFERTLVNVANRLADDTDITRADLTTIEDRDLPPVKDLQ